MSYASITQIQLAAGGAQRLLDLADQVGGVVLNNGTITDANALAVIADAQVRADAWIDSFLRLRFSTPLAVVPPTIAQISADEVVYRLRMNRGMIGEIYENARKERERELANLRDGKQRPDEPLPAKSTGVVAAFVENDSPFSRRRLKGIL